MSHAQIKNVMAEMNLNGMCEVLDRTLRDATENTWGYVEILDTLLQAESEHRDQKRTRRLIRNAKLRRPSRLEDVDTTAKRALSKAQIKELFALEWLKQSRPLLLIGQTGVGKTFLSEAIALHACERGFSTLFRTASEFLEQVTLARAEGSYLRMRDKMIKPRLLIIDDFGLRKLSATEAHDLCDILEARSTERSTLITTQLPLDHWSEVIEDPVVADAVIDRVKYTSLKITITGDSYRKKKGEAFDKRSPTK